MHGAAAASAPDVPDAEQGEGPERTAENQAATHGEGDEGVSQSLKEYLAVPPSSLRGLSGSGLRAGCLVHLPRGSGEFSGTHGGSRLDIRCAIDLSRGPFCLQTAGLGMETGLLQLGARTVVIVIFSSVCMSVPMGT